MLLKDFLMIGFVLSDLIFLLPNLTWGYFHFQFALRAFGRYIRCFQYISAEPNNNKTKVFRNSEHMGVTIQLRNEIDATFIKGDDGMEAKYVKKKCTSRR